VGQIHARDAACEQVIEPILHPKFSRRRPAVHPDEVLGPNNVLAKADTRNTGLHASRGQTARVCNAAQKNLCAMNTKISLKSLPDPVKPLSLQQVIDSIDKARGGWGAVEIAIELSKRREFLRFPITRCNLLRPWLLCSIPFSAIGESSEHFTIPCQRQQKARDYIRT
jgi:hypothetical protein